MLSSVSVHSHFRVDTGTNITSLTGGIVALFDIIISCLTCGRGGGRRRGGVGHSRTTV
jgi:hypothetical protein